MHETVSTRRPRTSAGPLFSRSVFLQYLTSMSQHPFVTNESAVSNEVPIDLAGSQLRVHAYRASPFASSSRCATRPEHISFVGAVAM
jgi:hypothetical protein